MFQRSWRAPVSKAFVARVLCLLGAFLCLWLTSCTQKVDFENDVPQRAKAISQAELAAIRQSMGSSKAREQYRSYTQSKTQGQLKKDLAQLEKEKREIERQISLLTQSKSSNICPICRRKYNIKGTPRKLVNRGNGKAGNAKRAKSKRNKGVTPQKVQPAQQQLAPTPQQVEQLPTQPPMPQLQQPDLNATVPVDSFPQQGLPQYYQQPMPQLQQPMPSIPNGMPGVMAPMAPYGMMGG